jgi:excisionase family DNA binding protein
MDIDELPPFLSIQQTADHLGMDARKVRELIRQGRLEARFVDDDMRIPPAAPSIPS